MKLFRCLPALPAVWLGLLVVPLSSCDKVGALVDKAKGLMGVEEDSDESEKISVDVSKADEKGAKAIIAAEPRMVIVEFYTDT